MPADTSSIFIGSHERALQVETLGSLLSQPNDAVPSSIFVYGNSSCGKKYVVTTMMKEFGLNYILFNCIESFSPKLLFETILGNYSCPKSLTGSTPSKKNVDSGSCNSCDNMMDFIILFKDKFKHLVKDEKLFIVLDKVERIRDTDDHILPAFLRLQELTGLNVCTILLSEVVWEKFHVKMGLFNPVKIFLPQYSKDDIIDILCLSYSGKYSKEFFRNFLSMFMSTFYRISRNLVKIRLFANNLFNKYCYPIESGEIKENDVSSLWRWIVPHLRHALQSGHYSGNSNTQLSIKNEEKIPKMPSLDLPFHSKMLLISAYLASYNSSKSDLMMFSKRKLNRKRKMKKKKRDDNLSLEKRLMNGPKPFTFDRMMAIFYCINECEKLHTSLLMSQVSYLSSVHLMDTFGEDMLDEPKYTCTASFDMISNVARSVDFNVVQLLHG